MTRPRSLTLLALGAAVTAFALGAWPAGWASPLLTVGCAVSAVALTLALRRIPANPDVDWTHYLSDADRAWLDELGVAAPDRT